MHQILPQQVKLTYLDWLIYSIYQFVAVVNAFVKVII